MTRPHHKRSPRPEGGGDFAPALGGGSGAKRVAGDPRQIGEASLCLDKVLADKREAHP